MAEGQQQQQKKQATTDNDKGTEGKGKVVKMEEPIIMGQNRRRET
jgi:hypothetical protein